MLNRLMCILLALMFVGCASGPKPRVAMTGDCEWRITGVAQNANSFLVLSVVPEDQKHAINVSVMMVFGTEDLDLIRFYQVSSLQELTGATFTDRQCDQAGAVSAVNNLFRAARIAREN